jgi:hypothetical protein
MCSCVGVLTQLFCITTCLLVLTTSGSESAMLHRKKNVVISEPIDRLNYGVTFVPIKQQEIASGTWSHDFVVSIPPPHAYTVGPSSRASRINCHMSTAAGSEQRAFCLRYAKIVSALHSLQESTLGRYHYTVKHIKQLIPSFQQDQQGSMRKRGIISWLGNLAGLATDDDLKRLANTVNKITKVRDDEITAFEKTLNDYSSMSKITNRRINNIRETLETHSLGLTELVTNMHAQVDDLNSLTKLLAVVIDRLDQIGQIRNHMTDLMEAVQLLSHGYLDPFLVSPNALNETFQQVRPQLLKIHPQLDIASNIFDMYRINDFTVTRVGLTLIISVRFPITVLNGPIQIFRAIALQTPLSYKSPDCTKLSELPWGIGTSQSDPFYLVFKEKPPFNNEVININKIDVTVMSTEQTSCIWALFSNSRYEIKQQCKFHLIPNGLKSEIRNLGNGIVLLTNAQNVTLVAGQPENDDITIPQCSHCIVKIPCGYSLESNHGVIMPIVENCDNSTGNDFQIKHTTNLALLQHYFNFEELDGLEGDTLLEHVLNVTIPKITLDFNERLAQKSAEDIDLKLQLEKVANLTKADLKIYSSLAHTAFDQLTTDDFEDTYWEAIQNKKNWLLLLTTVISVTALGSSILLGYKLRQLIMLIGALNHVPVVRAQRVPQYLIFGYSTPSAVFESNQTGQQATYLEIDIHQYYPAFDTACGLLILILCIVYLISKLTNKKQDMLVLLVSNTQNRIEIVLRKLKVNTNYCTFHCKDKLITSMSVIGPWYRPMLKLGFNDLKIHEVISDIDYKIDDQLKITPLMAYKLKTILLEQFRVSLLMKRKSELQPVSLVNENNDSIASFYQNEISHCAELPTAPPQFNEIETQTCSENKSSVYPLQDLKSLERDNVTFIKDE